MSNLFPRLEEGLDIGAADTLRNLAKMSWTRRGGVRRGQPQSGDQTGGRGIQLGHQGRRSSSAEQVLCVRRPTARFWRDAPEDRLGGARGRPSGRHADEEALASSAGAARSTIFVASHARAQVTKVVQDRTARASHIPDVKLPGRQSCQIGPPPRSGRRSGMQASIPRRPRPPKAAWLVPHR
jgi:hypothetical protein